MNYEFLGLIMVYSWVHLVIMLVQKTEYANRTQYEKIVTIVAITGLVLWVIGLLM